MKTHLQTLAVSMAVLCAFALSVATKPNFSGDWELNTAKSDLGGAPITRLVVHIEHKDPAFKYTAQATADGQDFEESESFATDGTPSRDSRGATVKAHWEGAALVIESTGSDGQLLDKSRLTLSADGKTTVRDYERLASDDRQKRHEIYTTSTNRRRLRPILLAGRRERSSLAPCPAAIARLSCHIYGTFWR